MTRAYDLCQLVLHIGCWVAQRDSFPVIPLLLEGPPRCCGSNAPLWSLRRGSWSAFFPGRVPCSVQITLMTHSVKSPQTPKYKKIKNLTYQKIKKIVYSSTLPPRPKPPHGGLRCHFVLHLGSTYVVVCKNSYPPCGMPRSRPR